MTPQYFDALVQKRFTKCNDTLTLKGEEYSREGDRLWNFKIAGAIINSTPEEALLGMLSKHWVSIIDMIRSNEPISQKMMDDKLNDAINYMPLLEGLLIERNERLSKK